MRSWNDIGLDADPVGDVDDRDLLALEKVSGLHQRRIECHPADIVEIGLRNRRARWIFDFIMIRIIGGSSSLCGRRRLARPTADLHC